MTWRCRRVSETQDPKNTSNDFFSKADAAAAALRVRAMGQFHGIHFRADNGRLCHEMRSAITKLHFFFFLPPSLFFFFHRSFRTREGQSEDSEGMRSFRKTALQVSDRVARTKGDGRGNVGETLSSYDPTDARLSLATCFLMQSTCGTERPNLGGCGVGCS